MFKQEIHYVRKWLMAADDRIINRDHVIYFFLLPASEDKFEVWCLLSDRKEVLVSAFSGYSEAVKYMQEITGND